jgi:hypothetical protein
MKYKLPSGKTINIKDSVIKQYMISLDLTEEEAIQTYLEDEGEFENEEQIALDEKAKQLSHPVYDNAEKNTKKKRKKPTVKVSDEKKTLFDDILASLPYPSENITVLKENKLIQIKINDKIFKIDVIQQRPPKK